ncbi:tetratricopeptide repeat protein [Luteolibacter algae]|uniref:Tetratricopeptide repeat protein n=1 Tax=Luteolibacter algae TaxID=454151 RepID=A0ABW5D3K1_9BACT
MKKLILALALVATSLPLAAAEEDDLPSLVNKGLQAMNEGNWEQALALNAEAVERFGGETALQLHGPQFGVIWFRKGISELKLRKYEDAMKSFEVTYKDFPNEGNTKGKNIFNKQALLKWGEAAMAAGQYELAIEKWKKFIQERDKARDSYPQGAFHINLAISFFRLGQMEEGIEHLEISIKNKDTFPTPRAAIVSGFQALVAAAVAAKDEQTALDFIEKNRGELIVEPFEMQRFSKLFMKLAGDAIAAKMPKLALNLYQFVPSTQVAIDDLRARINAMGALPRFADGATQLDKASMEKELAALEAEQRSSKSIEMIKLAAIAYLHEANGYVPGAYAAYLQLETHYPKAEKREDNLYNLVRTSSILGDVETTKKYGELFSKQFANSEHNANVQKMLLSSLFFDGKYETSIEIASDIIENNKAKEETPEHDLALFVLGGSYFYTGQYEKAEPILDQHVEKYPESLFALTSAYFQASNTSRLQLWTKAASQLDAFLTKYSDAKDQTYIPLALYDRANAHYSEEQPEGALEKLNRIIKEFPDSPITDQAYNLKGNVMQGEDKLEEAEESYKKALELAEARGHGGVAGEALYYLVALIGDQPEGDDSKEKLKEAVPFADLYWEKYSAGSPYNAQMAVAQLAPMSAAGRDDESLERLQKVISTMAKMPEAYGLEAAINSYTEAYLKKYTPEELKEHYYNFPGISVQDKAARALLRIAVIGVFEKVAENNENADKQRAAKAMIQVLFRNLKEDFEFKDLSNYILVKLGDYLRTNTSAPREAVPYYDEALKRPDKSYNFAALLGRADVYGNSSQDADLNKALEDFERIFKESDEKGQREFALFRIIEVLMKKGDYAKAAERANQYLNRDKEAGEVHGFTKYSPEVGYILAKSFEERDMIDDAISMYVKVWSAHMGYVKVSAPAIEAWMKLSHKRNNQSSDPQVPSDRQGAYEGGHRYIELTGRFKDKLSPGDLKLWEAVETLTETYEADPNIKSVEQIKKEKEEAAKKRR